MKVLCPACYSDDTECTGTFVSPHDPPDYEHVWFCHECGVHFTETPEDRFPGEPQPQDPNYEGYRRD